MTMKRIAWRTGIVVGLAAIAVLAIFVFRQKDSAPTPPTAVAQPAIVEAPLPDGVKAVWDLDKAFRETTPTRERVCLNGLWRWQPADANAAAVPLEKWGHFKVPGFWPGHGAYVQEDSQ